MPLAVADRLELSALVHRYAAAVDDRNFPDVVELFTETAELVLPNPPHQLGPTLSSTGPDGIRAAMATLDAVTRTQHEIVGEVYDGDADSATGRIICVAHHWTRSTDGAVTDLVWHLRYDDVYLPTPRGWRIARRALYLNAIETRPIRRLREH